MQSFELLSCRPRSVKTIVFLNFLGIIFFLYNWTTLILNFKYSYHRNRSRFNQLKVIYAQDKTDEAQVRNTFTFSFIITHYE